MWKYFTHRETLTYVDVLPDMVASYNHTVHRTIGIPPAEVTWANQTTVSQRLYGRKGPSPHPAIVAIEGAVLFELH
jgi:hypothetical protein